MNYLDFQIRAWQVDEQHAQVIVHSSPVGDMQKPLTVPLDVNELSRIRDLFADSWGDAQPCFEPQELVAVGSTLSSIILPPEVNAYLVRSFERIAAGEGLRVRLCLDDFLSDAPWEFICRPDVPAEEGLAGFISLNPRISLVRGAPLSAHRLQPAAEQQRLSFVGTLYRDGDNHDGWLVRQEHEHLVEALAPATSEYLLIDPFRESAGENIARALSEPASIFHYSGHIDVDGRGWYLAREAVNGAAAGPLYVEILAALLTRARTRLAAFSACNSSSWGFMKPLVRAGIPVLIGSHGVISSGAAICFFQKLYRSLSVGLSLDEAVTWARLHVLEQGGRLPGVNHEWAKFMVCMSTGEAVLFPKPPQTPGLEEQQRAARMERDLTINAATRTFPEWPAEDTAVDKTALRKVIERDFSLEDLRCLCADLRQDLSDAGIESSLDWENLEGDSKRGKSLSLIEFFERRKQLKSLVARVRAERPGAI